MFDGEHLNGVGRGLTEEDAVIAAGQISVDRSVSPHY